MTPAASAIGVAVSRARSSGLESTTLGSSDASRVRELLRGPAPGRRERTLGVRVSRSGLGMADEDYAHA